MNSFDRRSLYENFQLDNQNSFTIQEIRIVEKRYSLRNCTK